MSEERTRDSESSRSAAQAQARADHAVAQQRVVQRMTRVRYRILVLSGKGGVGKSTVAANTAFALARAGKEVGLLDIDIHGPSIPKLLHLEGKVVGVKGDTIIPVTVGKRLKVMSIGFLLPNEDMAVIWRGPRKYGLIQQFLADVKWGDLDVLVVDSPPGTGDEPLGVIQLIGRVDGAVIVTTPQDVAITDVRKCLTFCRQLEVPVLGVVENMSGFVCPKCGERFNIFKTGGGQRMAKEMGVPFLGIIPIDPEIVASCDSGVPYLENFSYTEAGMAFDGIAKQVMKAMADSEQRRQPATVKRDDGMVKIAIPVAEGRLSSHFGHCEEFALIEVDTRTKQIINKEVIEAPSHEPGFLPQWIQEQGATTVITGGMGARAQDLFRQRGISVVVGAPCEEPEEIVKAYLAGTLRTAENLCDH